MGIHNFIMFPVVRSKKVAFFQSVISFVIGFLISYDAATMHNPVGGNAEKERHSSSYEGDTAPASPLTTLELLGIVRIKQKQMYENILHQEYRRFSHIFLTRNLERIFHLTPLSRKRLIRKLIIKILLGRIHIEGRDDYHIYGEPVFRWVTIGDSSAAGHGNSYSHSYTSILEDTLRDVFHSAGIEFVATNRAGDEWSGMELALCMKQIVGQRDVDVMSWDFMRMNHDNAPDNYYSEDPLSSPGQGLDPLLFGERAGRVLPHLPFLFFLGLFSDGGMWERVQRLETSGLGVDILGGEALRDLILTFPNNNKRSGKSTAIAVDKFHCDGIIEGKETCDDPTQLFWCNSVIGGECANAKYLAGDSCGSERYQTSWNDGWKMHRLKGRLLGFHLVEMLRLAAVELDVLERQQPQLRNNPLDALDLLRAEEEVEEFLFLKTQPSRLHTKSIAILESWNVMKQRNSMCLNAKTALETLHSDSLPKFEFDPPQDLCEDFSPFQSVYFRLSKDDGWVSIDSMTQSQEVIVGKVALGLCFKHCYGNQCRENTPRIIDWEKVTIQIHGESISGFNQAGGCYMAQFNIDEAVGKSQSLVIKIQNRGDETLLVSSAFILY
jgi:hypothetical protein